MTAAQSSGEPVDLATWPRADAFRLFRRFAQPQYTITTRLDIRALLARRSAESGFPSYLACIHAVGAGLHQVPELGYRIRGEQVVRHARMRLSPTLQFADGRLGFAYLTHHADFTAFAPEARAAIDAALALGRMEPGVDGADDVAFLTCVPWMDFTQLDNPVFGPDDSIPRVSWGKFVTEGPFAGTMALALQTHHALLDGFHIGQFFAATQGALDRL